jgi:hypothetical protein
VAETGRSCWGRGQQDASGSEADAGSRNPGSFNKMGGRGRKISIAYFATKEQELFQSEKPPVLFLRLFPQRFDCFLKKVDFLNKTNYIEL